MNYFERTRLVFNAGISVGVSKTPRWQRALNIINSFNHSDAENLSPPDTVDAIIGILRNSVVRHDVDFSDRKYWQSVPWNREIIHAFELSGIGITFTDYLKKDISIPNYLIPPDEHFKKYLSFIMSVNKPLLLHEQFESALDIVGPYPLAASILLMLASRTLARRMDQRIFEKLQISKKDSIDFPYQIGSFGKHWVADELPDPPGNTYYFWTAVAMGMLLRADQTSGNLGDKIEDASVNFAFSHGAKMMWFGRKLTAKEPNQTTHKLPLEYGFKIGKYLAYLGLSDQL